MAGAEGEEKGGAGGRGGGGVDVYVHAACYASAHDDYWSVWIQLLVTPSTSSQSKRSSSEIYLDRHLISETILDIVSAKRNLPASPSIGIPAIGTIAIPDWGDPASHVMASLLLS